MQYNLFKLENWATCFNSHHTVHIAVQGCSHVSLQGCIFLTYFSSVPVTMLSQSFVIHLFYLVYVQKTLWTYNGKAFPETQVTLWLRGLVINDLHSDNKVYCAFVSQVSTQNINNGIYRDQITWTGLQNYCWYRPLQCAILA